MVFFFFFFFVCLFSFGFVVVLGVLCCFGIFVLFVSRRRCF